MANNDAIIGKNVRITLVSGAIFEGVVFSFVPDQDLLVLLRSIGDFKTTMHVVRLPFIKEVDLINGADRLPPALDRVEQLPTLKTTSLPVFRHISSLIKKNSDDRRKHLEKLGGAPARAVECFLKLSKFADVAEWDSHNKCINFGEVCVLSEDHWKTFKVAAVQSTEDESELQKQVERVKGYLSK